MAACLCAVRQVMEHAPSRLRRAIEPLGEPLKELWKTVPLDMGAWAGPQHERPHDATRKGKRDKGK